MLLQILAYIIVFYCGLKIGRILQRKRFVEFLMDGIEDDIKDALRQKIKNDKI